MIRPATPRDADAICAVHRACVTGLLDRAYGRETVEVWSASLRAENYVQAMTSDEVFFVADVGGCVSGFGARKEDEVTAVYVHPDQLRQGIGRALLRAIEQDARSHGWGRLRCSSTLPAVAFYEDAGYRQVGNAVHRLRSGAEVPVVKMQKDLA